MKYKRFLSIAGLMITGMLLLSLAACSGETSYTYGEERRVIIDADVAADDALSILMMAKAPNITIEGVTTLAGNVDIDQTCANALMTLETAGKPEVPVFKGSVTRFNGDPIESYSVFGEDGMGDQDLIHPSGEVQEQDAVDFIIETVEAHPGEIEILSTGPLTNIAKAMEKAPEVMSGVKHIWSMGSCGIRITGNASPVAEFNAYLDTDAYQYVMDFGVPVTVIGYDVCNYEDLMIGDRELETLSKAGECGEYSSKALTGLVDYYHANGLEKAQVCDPVAAASMIWSDFVTETQDCHAEIVKDDSIAKGAVLFFIKGFQYDLGSDITEWNCKVVSALNTPAYLDNVCALIAK